MTKFQHRPSMNILLGDSRMILLEEDKIKLQTNLDYFNFAYGGGSLEEIIETFWYADSLTKLSSVYIGMNFHLFNGYHRVNEVSKIRQYSDNSLLYLIDRVVFKAATLCLAEQLGLYKTEIERPDMTEDQFWDYQLYTTALGQFERYKYPESNYHELQNIVKYCDSNKIEIKFVIFPEHIDLLKQYSAIGLEKEYLQFKNDISILAPTSDFSSEIEIITKRSNFTDPYHFTSDISQYLIDDIW